MPGRCDLRTKNRLIPLKVILLLGVLAIWAGAQGQFVPVPEVYPPDSLQTKLPFADSLRVNAQKEIVNGGSMGAPEVEMRRHVSNYRKTGVYYPSYSLDPGKKDTNRNWWHLLKKGKLSLDDKSVEWPRFMRFCLGVYHWGDEFFNGFDTTYVVGTGRRWKVRLTSDLWSDSYTMKVGRHKPIQMLSHSVIHSGAYLQFMAVSMGYQIDMTNVIGNRPIDNRRLTFGFGCGLFNLDLAYTENDGGTYLRRFADYNDGKNINVFFPGLKMSSFETDLYFFVNHRKYSQVAAYSFGRYQKKRAGSLLIGASYLTQDIHMDFAQLPEYMRSNDVTGMQRYDYFYFNYNLLIGYGYNWPVRKHLLFNLTTLPAVGFNHRVGAREEKSTLFSAGLRAMASVTFNYGDFFLGLSGKFTGQFYYSHGSDLFSTIQTGQFTAGVRF